MSVLTGQEQNLKLIPIISSKPLAKLKSSEQTQYVIFLDDLAPKPLIGSVDCACPHCGKIDFDRWDVMVFAKPLEACCETSIKESIKHLWGTLKEMSLAEQWSEAELEKAEQTHALIQNLEAKLKVITN